MDGTCSVPNCTRSPAKVRGLCAGHNSRLYRLGSVMADVPLRRRVPGRDTCTVEDCGLPTIGQRLCGRHYQRFLKYGDPLGGGVRHSGTAVERFWAKIDKTEDCWIWQGHISAHGYGKCFPMEEHDETLAHRMAYTLTVGPIPDGLELDHLCHSMTRTCAEGNDCLHRRCVRPDHLTPVSHLVNSRRRVWPQEVQAH